MPINTDFTEQAFPLCIEKENNTCLRCRGYGIVEAVFADTYQEEVICPICNGDGIADVEEVQSSTAWKGRQDMMASLWGL